MTSDAGTRNRILGSLRSADSAGVVRIEDRYETTIDDLWQAVTDPDRLTRAGSSAPTSRTLRSRAPVEWRPASPHDGCW